MATDSREQMQGSYFAIGVDAAFADGALFVAEDIFGYAIVDTGATKSMTSFKQMEWLQNLFYSFYGKTRPRVVQAWSEFLTT